MGEAIMADNDGKAKAFIKRLYHLTEEILSAKVDASALKEELKSLEELFDSFAVVDEFTSFLIADCYNEIKISRMKWERFAKNGADRELCARLKILLDYFYSVTKNIYHYEVYGFFSTTLHPKEFLSLILPCNIHCGCVDGWQKEPYLAENGEAAYENVIRFEDPKSNETFCITIENPRLLEPREKCSLSDEELESIKKFVRENEEIIVAHNAGLIDSAELYEALKIKKMPGSVTPTYCLAFSCERLFGAKSVPSQTYFIYLANMTYAQAKKFYSKLKRDLDSEPRERMTYYLRDIAVLKFS